MTGQIQEVIQFCCPSCGAELTVPNQLAGIEGPCPSCYTTIRAPRASMGKPPAKAAGAWPPENVPPGLSIPARPNIESTPVESFRARYLIPPAPEEDTSWVERSKERSKKQQRRRRLENSADTILKSDGMRYFRAALITVSAALFVWLLTFLQSNNWKLPWKSSAVARPALPVKKPAGEVVEDVTPDSFPALPQPSDAMPAGPGVPSGNLASPPN